MAFLTSSQHFYSKNPTCLFSPSTSSSTTLTSLFLHLPLRNRKFRSCYKKRRSKKSKPLLNNLNSPSPSPSPSSPFSFDFLSLLPLDWVPPAALGFASAIAISISNPNVFNQNQNQNRNRKPRDVGEWILFTSPTPFNRFVLLRCPSISFEGEEGYVEGEVSEKLVTEDRHYVRLDSGRIRVSNEGDGEGDGDGDGDGLKVRELEAVEYQRECVRTSDGGVISLDWPENLDLREERGLDTTVLLIPGTAKGSMEENVRFFVRKCMNRGLFPVVMNPRGCAGSPLTTARLFTAADSDDISSAIQFITKARPWSTLTGVGWGYGANMLTKYLAEAGEKTPLTAATCIDNPFDLDEATRTSPYCSTLDGKLIGGLTDILMSNKELFQGRGKGFDVEKASTAESVRDFEKAISMVSYGFDTLEEFYSNSSTRLLVGNLKIPVLFVQNDNGSVPLFSIPRGSIAENPFTSLLLCSCLPSDVTAHSWYQQVAIEWLTAVELGLLKGRHPLLQDIDVTVKPSKGLALVEGRTSDKGGRLDDALDLANLHSSGAYIGPTEEMVETDPMTSILLKLNQNSVGNEVNLRGSNGAFPHRSSKDENSTVDTESSLEESDAGKVLQTAEVVMNMLDVTMPGTLKEEDKRKVLSAVGQGETLIKALEDAVPEDVRGKLTNSVVEILQTQGKNLDFDKVLSISRRASTTSGLKSKNPDNTSLDSDSKTGNNDQSSDNKVSGGIKTDGVNNNQVDVERLGAEDSGAQHAKTSVESNISDSNVVESHDNDTGSVKVLNDPRKSEEKHDNDASVKKVGQISESVESVLETTSDMNSSSHSSGDANSEAGVMQINRSHDDGTHQKESSSEEVGVRMEFPDEEDSTSSTADAQPANNNAATSSFISEQQQQQQSDKSDDGDNTKGELVQSQSDQNKASESRSSTFSVSQALDALTGFDDSTQMAVNSVFSVLEDMIDQFEEKNNGTIVNKANEMKDVMNGSVIEKDQCSSELQLEKQSDGEDEKDTVPLDVESVNPHGSNINMINDLTPAGVKKNIENLNLIASRSAASNADRMTSINKNPFYVPSDPYVKALCKEFLRKYVLSEIRKKQHMVVGQTTTPFLDYNPEDGHWLLLKQPDGIHVAVFDNSKDRKEDSKILPKKRVMDNVIEPSYVILNKEGQEEPTEDTMNNLHHKDMGSSNFFVKSTLLNSLKTEVGRRLNATNMEDVLAVDMEEVANAVYLAIQHDVEHNQKLLFSGVDPDFQEWSRLNGDRVVEVISKAVQNTSYLKKVLPVGVIVGSTFAALRNCVNLAASAAETLDMDQDHIKLLKPEQHLPEEVIELPTRVIEHQSTQKNILGKYDGRLASSVPDEDDMEKAKSKSMNRDTLMVGAVTAALGASALLTSQQDNLMRIDNCQTSEEQHMKSETVKLEEIDESRNQGNIITSLAEKAMSVAAPVVPTKENGAVDQERLVTMLAELGQRGGVLRLVGKLALLWGGLRGAMSLTDRLISFLRIADRPLLHRVLGFSCMVLVLWSPVLVPLLPTLFHNMVTHTSSRIAELACVVGLYTAVTILIIQWGKRIRGYEYPLKQYGLDFTSSKKVQHFLIGLVGGVILVASIHSLNSFLGFVDFSFPSSLVASSLSFSAKIKAHCQLILLAGQGLLIATGVAFVEELLFRSWLLEEIAADLGYHPGILLSGLAFALSQRSWQAIPGLWLLSMCLAGARLKKEGSLFIPLGLRTGLLASSYVLQTGGFLVYRPKFPWWVVGNHPFQPFNGVLGLLIALLLAVALYPRQPGLREGIPLSIRA